MSTSYRDALIKCPFYKESAKKSISCEGLTEDSIIKLLFNSPKKMVMHCRIFCEHRYKACEIYNMLEKKYEE